MTLVAVVGILASVIKAEAANGIGLIVGSVVAAIGGAVAVYSNSQSRVDVAESAHGPHPKRQSVQARAVAD